MVSAETSAPVAQSGKSPNSKTGSPSKEVEQSPEEVRAAAFASLATGKRHLLVQDIPLAVSTLGEACELLSGVSGETAAEMAEVYFYYGKALLELARLESGVLGNALDGVPEDEDNDSSQVENPEALTEEEKEEVEDKVDEALESNFEKHDKIAKIHNGRDANGDGETEEEDDEESANGENEEEAGDCAVKSEETPAENGEKAKEVQDSDVEGGEKEGEDQSAQEAEEEDDPSNLQLAWEMLELAKVVYTKNAEGSEEMGAKLCETFMVLGEVSLENENYPQAVEDLGLCLARRAATLPADSRSIAETHYQLGIAQGFDMKWEEAVASLEAAIAVLQTRVANLKAEKESQDGKEKDSFYTREKEVAELEALIPEIKEKIADTKEMKVEQIRKMKEAVGFTSSSSSSSGGASTSGASSSGAKPMSIAIKRKGEDKEGEVKKVKADGEAPTSSSSS